MTHFPRISGRRRSPISGNGAQEASPTPGITRPGRIALHRFRMPEEPPKFPKRDKPRHVVVDLPVKRTIREEDVKPSEEVVKWPERTQETEEEPPKWKKREEGI